MRARLNIDPALAVIAERMNKFTAATAMQVGKDVVEAQNAFVKADSVMSTEHAREVKRVVSLHSQAFAENKKILEEKLAVQ